jgi:hypothetical protein
MTERVLPAKQEIGTRDRDKLHFSYASSENSRMHASRQPVNLSLSAHAWTRAALSKSSGSASLALRGDGATRLIAFLVSRTSADAVGLFASMRNRSKSAPLTGRGPSSVVYASGLLP